jgi:RNA polymerase sigma-70 factor (ECF subfamily)
MRHAYRMLGTVGDAQDMVQETWTRWQAAERSAVREPRAWLLRTCSRLCLDQLKSARRQREVYPGPWLPEPLVLDVAVHREVEDVSPVERLELDESVSMALLTTLERLSPAERAALLLHDVFDHDYAEVAETLGRNEAACRKLVSRARQRVQQAKAKDAAEVEVTPEDHRRLLAGFLHAAGAGDFDGLKAVLCDDVALHSDGGGKALAVGKVLEGAELVAKFFVGLVTRSGVRYDPTLIRWCWYNGAPGVVILDDPEGPPVTAMSIRIEDGRIAELYALRNPDKLAVLKL